MSCYYNIYDVPDSWMGRQVMIAELSGGREGADCFFVYEPPFFFAGKAAPLIFMMLIVGVMLYHNC